jgi:Icc-related predicted phosphoesterase
MRVGERAGRLFRNQPGIAKAANRNCLGDTMLKIIAVSDLASKYLELCLCKKKSHLPADVLCSCGDVPLDFLELLKIYVSENLLMVMGNEDKKPSGMSIMGPASMNSEDIMEAFQTLPGKNIHGRVVSLGGFLFCGFSGVRSSQDRPFHSSEWAMRGVVRRVKWRVRQRQWLNRFLGRPAQPVVVLSHVPPSEGKPLDASTSFVCFMKFIKTIQPVLWLHGHEPLSGYHQVKNRQIGKTLVVNAYEYKRIEIDGDQVRVEYKIDASTGSATTP